MTTARDYTRSTSRTPADRAITLHATIAAAGRVYRNALLGTSEYEMAEQILEMAEPAYAAMVPTTHRGALLKLGYAARYVAALAESRADHPAIAAARALRVAVRKVAPGNLDAMPALRRAAAQCRGVVDTAATVPIEGYANMPGYEQISQEYRALLLRHLDTALAGLSRPRFC